MNAEGPGSPMGRGGIGHAIPIICVMIVKCPGGRQSGKCCIPRAGPTLPTVELQAYTVQSGMPVHDLIGGFKSARPAEVLEVTTGLVYRDFLTVGLLLKRLRTPGNARATTANGLIPDCWIYIQEPYVKVGRAQIFNNWSPCLVGDPSTLWIGLEYVCTEGDDLWRLPEPALTRLAAEEISQKTMSVEQMRGAYEQ